MSASLETPRLSLRLPRESDFDDGWAEMHGDAEAMRHLGGALPRSVAWRVLAQVVGMWSLLGFGQFSVIEKASGRWIGRVGPWRPEGWPAAEIGWMLHPDAWGRGYATEAASVCMDYAIGVLGWDRVTHMIHPYNMASQAVAQRLGSAFVEEVRLPAPSDAQMVQMWGQSASDWRARKRKALPVAGEG
jgi:RimJ/RimL family protein N-acetyltransferase